MTSNPPSRCEPLPAVSLAPAMTIEVFFDGDCPLCQREIAWIMRRNGAEKIRFTDIAAPGFEPHRIGITQAQLMAEIHGRLPDGSWIAGVEVFRRIYGALGHTWLVAISRLPIMRSAIELAYRWFARYRLRLTGRCGTTIGGCSLASMVDDVERRR